VRDIEEYAKAQDRYYAANDENFISGDSPVVLDVYATLKTFGKFGSIKCPSSTGTILVEISTDGTTYQQQFVIDKYETFELIGIKINKIRITHSGTNSAYRIFVR